MSFTIQNIESLNQAIKEHGSLAKVPAEIKGLSDRQIKRNAQELGYEYSKDEKQFIKIEVPTMTQEEIIQRLLKIEKILSKDGATNKASKEIHIDKKYTTDGITRSFNVSKSAIDKFNKVAESKFAQYRKQDLLTVALLDFIEKYK